MHKILLKIKLKRVLYFAVTCCHPLVLLNWIVALEATARDPVIHSICLKLHFLDFRPTDYQGFQRFAATLITSNYLK
jgi:hypothetical protein